MPHPQEAAIMAMRLATQHQDHCDLHARDPFPTRVSPLAALGR